MHFTIREFGYLGTHESPQGMDYACVPRVMFNELRDLALSRVEGEAELLRIRSYRQQECLQVVNYVGLLQMRHGHQLEILPKTTLQYETADAARKLLWQMLRVVNNIKARETHEASLATLPDSWLESLIRLVLSEISNLVRHGIRRDYVRIEAESNFLKGQLRVAQQMRSRPGRDHKFAIQYDQYLPDRPENRLIKTCLMLLNSWTRQFENRRQCRELLFVFDEISASQNTVEDIKKWSTDRGMVHYKQFLPWVKLIIANQSPVFSKGASSGISLLFPMERLFEDYVAKLLANEIAPRYRLKTQAASQYLVTHNDASWFQLKPDILIQQGNKNIAVLDTKWKLLESDANTGKDKYGLSQSDMYQLYAYGQKYLGGVGEMMLIYPRHEGFAESLPCFSFDSELSLWAVPFDIDSGKLVPGAWMNVMSWVG